MIARAGALLALLFLLARGVFCSVVRGRTIL